MSRVRDILQNRELFHVEENDTVANVVRRMAEIRVGAILVFEGEQLRGVFSERDLMKRVVLERLDPELTLVKNVMSTDIATIDETASLEEAMAAAGQEMPALEIAIGPEGGWAPDEEALFDANGWRAASLGPRILRAETAAIAALAVVASYLE